MAARKPKPKEVPPSPVPKKADWKPSTLQARFLSAMGGCGTIKQAAKIADVDESNHRKNWVKDPEYREAFEEAKNRGVEDLEDEARRRAKKGSDVLLIFLLKAARPHIYREKIDHAHSGTVEVKMYGQEAPVDRV